MGWMIGGSSPGRAWEIFSPSPPPDRLWGPTKPLIQCVKWALSLRVKRPARGADRSSSSSAEVKNAWSYTSTAQITPSWRGAQLKPGDFTFTFDMFWKYEVGSNIKLPLLNGNFITWNLK